jgi:ParB-like chromosome segregation protein Spo0J
LKVVYRLIDDLKPDPANPRRHSKKQIRQIANSLKTFGFNVPILIDGDNGCSPLASGAWPWCRRCASTT